MIVLLTRGRDPVIDPELAALDAVHVFRVPPAENAGARTAPDWAQPRLADLADLLAGASEAVAVCGDDRARPFGWRVAERFPDLSVLASQHVAAKVLAELRRRGQPPTADHVRRMLDPMRPAPAPVPGFLVDPGERPPMVVAIAQEGTEHAVRTARTVASWGFDSVLVHATTDAEGGYRICGDAVIVAVPETSRVRGVPADAPAPRSGAPAPAQPGTLRRGLGSLRRRLGAGSTHPQPQGRQSAPRGADRSPTAEQLTGVVSGLSPTVLHVHDWALLPVARAVRRHASRAGQAMSVILDVRGAPRVELAALSPAPDAVITSSAELAALVAERYGVRAVVVQTCPDGLPSEPHPDVRSELRITASRPVVAVVADQADPEDGDLSDVVRAMSEVAEADLVVVSEQGAPVAAMRLARTLGIRHRVHLVDPPPDLPAYLATVNVIILPRRQDPLTVADLYPACVQGGIPMIGPGAGATGRLIEADGTGRIWNGGRVELQTMLRELVTDPEHIAQAFTPELRASYTWAGQGQHLARVYESLTPAARERVAPDRPGRGVLVGPANSAGQATAWARALSASGVPAWSLEYRSPDQPFAYPVDQALSRDSVTGLDRHLQVMFRLVLPCDTVVMESAKWIAAPEPGPVPHVRWGMREARRLQESGRNVGLIFHGSDLRRPDVHARTHPWSPFRNPANRAITEHLLRRTRVTHEELASWDGPVMVSTPDLLRQHPAAEWVPVVIDVEAFSAARRPELDGGELPVVLHLPSSAPLKGSALIDPVLHRLAAEQVIRYRRLQSVPHAQVPALLAECDIVVDQLGMGILGVAALEAMATARLVVTDPGEEALSAYGESVPLVAVTPDSLEAALRDLATDSARRQELAEAGPAFVARHHDGRRSAEAMCAAMGL